MKPSPEILQIFESVSEASLGTLESAGPYVSAAGVLYEKNESSPEVPGSFYLFLSALARHTRNLQAHPQASLLLVNLSAGKPFHESPRATVLGEASPVLSPEKTAALRNKYVERFPGSAVYAVLPDFRFYEFTVREIHWIGGFGAVQTLR